MAGPSDAGGEPMEQDHFDIGDGFGVDDDDVGCVGGEVQHYKPMEPVQQQKGAQQGVCPSGDDA